MPICASRRHDRLLNLHNSQNCTPTLRRSGITAPQDSRFALQRVHGVRGTIPRDVSSRPMIPSCKRSMSEERRNYILPVFPKTSKRGRLHLAQHHLIRSSPHVASKLSPHGAETASRSSALRELVRCSLGFPCACERRYGRTDGTEDIHTRPRSQGGGITAVCFDEVVSHVCSICCWGS